MRSLLFALVLVFATVTAAAPIVPNTVAVAYADDDGGE